MAKQTKTTESPWENLSPDEKLEKRLEAWLSPPGIKFASPEAETGYKARVTRLVDAIRLKKIPDRVPVMPGLGEFTIGYYGYTQRDMMYDVDKCIDVAMRGTVEFDLDQRIVPFQRLGKVLELMESKTYKWPGHGIPLDGEAQFIEGEYMKADEYDAFLEDPSDWYIRTYLPRTMGNVSQIGIFTYGSNLTERISEFGKPEARVAMEKLLEAGKVALVWQEKIAATNRKLTELGYPNLTGSNSGAPFDRLSDNLRGQRGIALDMYRQPEKLLKALEKVTEQMIQSGIKGARMGNAPVVNFNLHKGADGFMNDEQFKTFYWGPLRKVIIGLSKEGLISRLGAQGGYNSRLEVIRDVPKGMTIWALGYATDMAKGKEALKGIACIMGNLLASLLHTGTKEEVVASCRWLIDTVGKDGGYMFSTSSIDRNAKPENVWAMVKFVKEYGVYK